MLKVNRPIPGSLLLALQLRRARATSLGLGIAVALLGLIGVTGWLLHSSLLIRLAPSFAEMPLATAAAFVVGGLSLVGAVVGEHSISWRAALALARNSRTPLFRFTLAIDLMKNKPAPAL